MTEIKKGYKKTKLGIIPEDWEVVALGDLGTFKNGINKDKDQFGFGKPMVNLNDIFSLSYSNLSLVNVNDIELKNYNLCKGDVLFVRSSVKPQGVGLTNVIKEDLTDTVYSGFIIRYRSSKNISLPYKKHCFFEEGFRNRLIRKSTISANTNINQETLKKLLIPLPPLPEQKKIAEILSTWDEGIARTQDLLEQLRLRKKGLMQQLLSGKKRLPGFTEDWKEVKFQTFIKERREIANENLPLYSLTINEGVTPKTERYERSFLLNSKEDAYKKMVLNDFAYNPMNLRFGAIAKHKTDLEIAVSRYYNIFYCLENCNSVFIEYYLKSYPMIQYYNRMATGTLDEKKRVHFKEFLNFKKLLPSLQEQQAIASVLSKADEEISHYEAYLAQLQAQKKGLMQQLLTGQKRVVC